MFFDSDNSHNNRNYSSQITCNRCGKYGHISKNCSDAVLSVGIILIKLSPDIMDVDNLCSALNSDKLAENISGNGISIENFNDIQIFSNNLCNIKFLMIQRKHSLGYTEFIRGRYKYDNIDGLVFLFQQMTSGEILKIKNNDISVLWGDYWCDDTKKLTYDKEYCKSKDKFDALKNCDENNSYYKSLDFYTNNVTPKWGYTEWGFPKGRRNKNENVYNCAIREFEEESGYTKDDYKVIQNIKPLVEEFIGTNGVRYKHLYYVALATNNKEPKVDENNKYQHTEIGDIAYFNFNDATCLIRPYHSDRKKIIFKLYMFMLQAIVNNTKTKTIT